MNPNFKNSAPAFWNTLGAAGNLRYLRNLPDWIDVLRKFMLTRRSNSSDVNKDHPKVNMIARHEHC